MRRTRGRDDRRRVLVSLLPRGERMLEDVARQRINEVAIVRPPIGAGHRSTSGSAAKAGTTTAAAKVRVNRRQRNVATVPEGRGSSAGIWSK